MRLYVKDLIHIFFPERCVICKKQLIGGEETVCVSCRHDLPLTEFSFEEDNVMEKTFTGRVRIETATALFYFFKKGNIQKLIHELKYHGHQEAGRFIGDWLGNEMKLSNRFNSLDLIVPVPLHPKKLKRRGYNQVFEFGKSISKALNIPVVYDLLKRNLYTETQTYKHRINRFQNTKNIFEITQNDIYRGKHILLIDDVLTTGATLEACCEALEKIPDVKISIATMAYTP